jgi:hypothetical protein
VEGGRSGGEQPLRCSRGAQADGEEQQPRMQDPWCSSTHLDGCHLFEKVLHVLVTPFRGGCRRRRRARLQVAAPPRPIGAPLQAARHAGSVGGAAGCGLREQQQPCPSGQAGRREGTHSCLRRPPADSRRWRQPARSHCPARPSWDCSPQQCLASRSWHPVQSAVTAETGGLGTQTTSNGQRRRGCWGDGYGYCSICPRQQPVPRVLLSATLDPRHPNFGVARCRGVAGRSTGA